MADKENARVGHSEVEPVDRIDHLNAATQNASAGRSMKVFDQHEVAALLVILWIKDTATVRRD